MCIEFTRVIFLQDVVKFPCKVCFTKLTAAWYVLMLLIAHAMPHVLNARYWKVELTWASPSMRRTSAIRPPWQALSCYPPLPLRFIVLTTPATPCRARSHPNFRYKLKLFHFAERSFVRARFDACCIHRSLARKYYLKQKKNGLHSLFTKRSRIQVLFCKIRREN